MTGEHGASPSGTGSGEPSGSFRSAEEWLASKGIERRPITVEPEVGPDETSGTDADAGPAAPPSARELGQLATEAPAVVPGAGVDPATPGGQPEPEPDASPDAPVGERRELGDEVARALTFIQRSTASAPASSGRLARKLADRDVPAAAIRLAMADATDQGLVDDRAMAAALVAEGRAKGHAPRRLRTDLRKRELPDDVVDVALATIGDRDPEAVAFDVAQRKAREYRSLDAETSFRRLVGFLARRGHNEGLARKVARQVVFDDRESDRVAGH